MDLKEFLEKTEPEVLEKLAANAQDELITKVVEAMFPLFEKTANYTAYLILEKLAEEANAKEANVEKAESEEAEKQEPPKTEDEAVRRNFEENKNSPDPWTPASGGSNNILVDPSVTPGGMKAQDVKDALSEALQLGESGKVLPFVKAVAEQYPETVNELIKMVKVELQDAYMKKFIDEETAASLSDQLNEMVGDVK